MIDKHQAPREHWDGPLGAFLPDEISSMKLSDGDRAVMAYLFFQGDAPMPEAAKATGLREHTVRHSIDKLLEHGIVYRSLITNPYAMGSIEYQAFFKVITPGERALQELIAALNAMPEVSFVSALSGPYQLDVIVDSTQLSDLHAVFDRLSEKIPQIEFEKIGALTTAMTHFAPKYLGKFNFGKNHLSYSAADKNRVLDPLEKKILSALVDPKLKNYAEVSRFLQIPASTLSYRIRSLRDKGVILGFSYMIDPFAAGFSPHLLLLHLQRSNADLRRKLFDFCERHPNISYLIENLGAWDFQIGVRLTDPRGLPALVQNLKAEFAPFLNTITQISVLERHKLKPFLPATAPAVLKS